MKKILTASLVAMMAVTAANADIASTNFVKSQTGSDVAFKAGDFSGAASKAANLKDAVNAIAGAVDGLNGSGANSVAGQVDTLKKDVIGNLAEGKTVVQMIGDAQSAGEAAAGTAKTEAIAAAKTETTNQVAAAKTELGTTITNTAASTLSDAKAYADGLAGNYDAAGSATAAETAAKAYTDLLANGAVKTNTAEIGNINTKLSTMATSDTVTTLTTRVDTITADYLKAADKTALEGEIAAVDTLAKANQAKIDDKTTGLAATKAIADANKATLDKLDDNYASQAEINAVDAVAKANKEAIEDADTGLAKTKQIADAAMNWTSIKDTSWTNAGCGGEGVVCSLVSKGGNIGWEKVVD